jgi:uncharacterized low-complexity protein
MKNMKFLASILFALTLTIGLASCNSSKTENNEATEQVDSTSATSEVTEQATNDSTVVDTAKTAGKCGEGKCGEGKCGNGK